MSEVEIVMNVGYMVFLICMMFDKLPGVMYE